MVSMIKQRAARNGALTNHQRHMLQTKKKLMKLLMRYLTWGLVA